MPQPIPTVSLFDSLIYNLVHVLPYYLQGIFFRNRFWTAVWTHVHPDPMAVKFGSYLRRKYKSTYCYIYMLTTKSLLVLDHDGIKRVLDLSPAIYAEAPLKRNGMAHFQPHAVTISRGAAWQERRRFNEAVLQAGHRVHQYAAHFLGVIRHEIVSKHRHGGAYQSWEDFEDLFERITLQIIFGPGVYDTPLAALLTKMMRESNRVFALRKSRHFDRFYDQIRLYLTYPPARSLVSLCTQVPSTEATRVPNQIPHWIFAMKDTLAANTVRALALIVTHAATEARVREEMAQADLTSPEGIHSLQYLTGCVQEAMRLWPSIPILVRETVITDVLGDTVIPSHTQVLILNTFNHRDRDTHAFADTFSPEVWLNSHVNYYFNHLSNGPQVCAGKDLALFIAQAVLATLLHHNYYILEQPALNPNQPLPHSYNYFCTRFRKVERALVGMENELTGCKFCGT